MTYPRTWDRERVRWEAAIDQAIRRKLIETGEVHANDVDDLPVPLHLRKSLIGQRFKYFSQQKLMSKTSEYRTVRHRAAHGRPAPVYRITPKGRAQLVGSNAGNNGVTPAAPRPAGVRSGEATPAGKSESACPPAGEPRLFDIGAARERPLNPLTDSEAA